MFELLYEPLDNESGYIHIIVNGEDVSEYSFRGNIYYGMCRINVLINWIKDNMEYILSDDLFPLETTAGTGADMWLYSDHYNPNDFEKMISAHQKRQYWIWHHAIDTCKEEFCMPFVVFRKVNNEIEISWNNSVHNYNGVKFRYLNGSCIIKTDEFKSIIDKFMTVSQKSI